MPGLCILRQQSLHDMRLSVRRRQHQRRLPELVARVQLRSSVDQVKHSMHMPVACREHEGSEVLRAVAV
eukprot:306464-Hanusia_phi.AAC.1